MRWRRAQDDVVRARVLGQCGVRFRGDGAVRTVHGEGHGQQYTVDAHGAQRRGGNWTSPILVKDDTVAELVESVTAAWDEVVASWPAGQPVVLFDEASRVLTHGVFRWAGVEPAGNEVGEVARDLVAMVDRSATPGPRYWRARSARRRCVARLGGLVDGVRSGAMRPVQGSALDVVSWHRGPGGKLLSPKSAAVRLLNVVRPTVAVCWFVAFAGHALYQWPKCREQLRTGGAAYAEAFAHELRRFYPFAPFIGARAVKEVIRVGETIPLGALALLDLYGQNHGSRQWTSPYTFDPSRFLGRNTGAVEVVDQGAGEPFTMALLQALAVRLSWLDYKVPDQDLTVSLRRIPARPRSGFVLIPE